MFITFQNIKTDNIDFDSLVGKYICFLGKDVETLNTVVGKYVTNCNYIYKVLNLTEHFMVLEADFHGNISKTKLRKTTFKECFFKGSCVICDEKPVDGIEVGNYNIDFPSYQFKSTTNLNKKFTTEEINELLVEEFLQKEKTYQDVKICIETLCNIVMKRHFDYKSVSRSYFQYTNDLMVGLNIATGYKYIDSFGSIKMKSYKGKITHIEFKPHEWLNRYVGFEDYTWDNLENLIKKYLTDNQEYIENL